MVDVTPDDPAGMLVFRNVLAWFAVFLVVFATFRLVRGSEAGLVFLLIGMGCALVAALIMPVSRRLARR